MGTCKQVEPAVNVTICLHQLHVLCTTYIQNLQVLVIPQFSTAQQRHQALSAQLSVEMANIPNNAHH